VRFLAVPLLVLLAACASAPPRPLAASEALGARAASLARGLAGVPYRYGGADPDVGFDCSGLVFYVYGRLGVTLPRRAHAQHRAVRRIPVDAVEPGDLVFFATPKDHVGLYLGAGEFVHAPAAGRRVQIARLDAPGLRERYTGAGRIAP
jgi:cell wall-associated NlpC family hydrolase